MTTLLFILAFLWVWFGITLHKLMQGVKIESLLKKLLYLVLVAPAIALEYMQSLSIRGTVGMWFCALRLWFNPEPNSDSLTPEQQRFVLENWDKLTLGELAKQTFKDESLNGLSSQAKSIKSFLASIDPNSLS